MVSSPVTLLAWFAAAVLPGLAAGKAGEASAELARFARPVGVAELVDALRDWNSDYAVLLHASWCPYCKQFRPVWHQVARSFAETPSIAVVSFDCETDQEHRAVCSYLGVTQYPSVMFLGHGSYMTSNPISRLFNKGGQPPERTVMYRSDLYYEAVRDWCRTMRYLSVASRWKEYVVNLLSGNKHSNAKLAKLKAENAELRSQLRAKAKAATAAAGKATAESSGTSAAAGGTATEDKPQSQTDRLLAKYRTENDVFAVLAGSNYGLATGEAADEGEMSRLAPFIRQCMAEVAWQYCQAEGTKAGEYCQVLQQCYAQDFASDVCRPTTCPLDARGCDLTSICMHPDILAEYAAEEKSQPQPEQQEQEQEQQQAQAQAPAQAQAQAEEAATPQHNPTYKAATKWAKAPQGERNSEAAADQHQSEPQQVPA